MVGYTGHCRHPNSSLILHLEQYLTSVFCVSMLLIHLSVCSLILSSFYQIGT